MSKSIELHLHIHEGASPEAVRAAVEAVARQGVAPTAATVAVNGAGHDQQRLLVERAYLESDGSMKPLLDFLAANPDRHIPYAEVNTVLGFPTARSLPGLLGAFGRRAIHRYDGFWPFEKEWENESWHMWMSAENAAIIRAL